MIIKSLNAKTQVVWSEDPALDRTAPGFSEAWARYEKDRDVAQLAAFVRDGGKLTIFEVGGLTRRQYQRVIDADNAEKFDEAVAFGLRSISGDGFRTVDANGASIPVTLEWEESSRGRRLKESTRDDLYFPTLWAELFTAIVEGAKPHP